MGRYDEAMTLLEEGLRFAKTAPNSRAHRGVQSMMDCTIGEIQHLTGHLSEALASFKRSLAIIEAELAHPQPVVSDRGDSGRAKAALWRNIGALLRVGPDTQKTHWPGT